MSKIKLILMISCFYICTTNGTMNKEQLVRIALAKSLGAGAGYMYACHTFDKDDIFDFSLGSVTMACLEFVDVAGNPDKNEEDVQKSELILFAKNALYRFCLKSAIILLTNSLSAKIGLKGSFSKMLLATTVAVAVDKAIK